MSRSRKKNPFYALNSHYNLGIGKKLCRHKFRSISKLLLRVGHMELMPLKMCEVSEIWDITDGKLYCPPTLINEEMKLVLGG